MTTKALNINGEIIGDDWTLFLNRDGVINERKPNGYITKIKELKFLDGMFSSLSKLQDTFKRIIIVTNQDGLSNGNLTLEDVESVNMMLMLRFESHKINIDKIFVCSKSESEEDTCKKPSPKMGLLAKNEFPDIDFSKSIMIGDSKADMGFAKALGMKTILFLNEADKREELLKLDVDKRVESWNQVSFE